MTVASWAIAALVGGAGARAAELAIIVNKDNAGPIDDKMVADIYTGQTKLWRTGDRVVAFDLPEDAPVRAAFSTGVLGKSVSNMKALAAQNLFSGKAVPPKQLTSDDEVKKAVNANKSAVGYIKASSVDDTVKVVLTR
jgi:ABC-type phosphate transport system substrate-binding protein